MPDNDPIKDPDEKPKPEGEGQGGGEEKPAEGETQA
jgi:hypothetical protein